MVAYVSNSAAAGENLNEPSQTSNRRLLRSLGRSSSLDAVGRFVGPFLHPGRSKLHGSFDVRRAAAARSALRCLFAQSAHSPLSFASFAGGEGEGELEQVGPRTGTVPLLLSLLKMGGRLFYATWLTYLLVDSSCNIRQRGTRDE